MITSGRAEFGGQVWPLVADPDTQIHLSAMRAARRFRPSVLGPDAAARLAALPDEVRENIFTELVMRGGMDGITLKMMGGNIIPRIVSATSYACSGGVDAAAASWRSARFCVASASGAMADCRVV
jgi:hypothetical protein